MTAAGRRTHRHTLGHEHEFEPVYGLPEELPADERVLWQGSPDAWALACRAFHLRKLALYFAAMLALRAGSVLNDGGTLGAAMASLAVLAPLALLALAAIGLMARLSARGAVYTITDKRVVMRIGIVLTVTFNLPYQRIEGAALVLDAGGCGDLPLQLKTGDRIAWLHLWPHARPWRLRRPEPMLRCVPEGARVAELLSQAWSEANGPQSAAVLSQPRSDAPRPVRVLETAAAGH